MIKRIIFDLDDTLIPWTKDYYQDLAKLIHEYDVNLSLDELIKISEGIDEYENNCQNYNEENFKKIVSDISGIEITNEVLMLIKDWVSNCVPKEKDSELIATLDYLSSKYELVVLTNFFYDVQYKRLEKYQIAHYFKEVYGADEHSKPNKEAYIMAANKTDLKECLMIGDNKRLDYDMPRELGMQAIWVTDKKEKDEKTITKIAELKNIL